MAEKAKSVKRSGLFDDAMDTISGAYDKVKKAVTPESGSLLDKMANQRREKDKQIAKAENTPKPKKEQPTTKQTRVKPQRKLTAAEAEKARKAIAKQKAEGKKNPKYTPKG